MKCGYAMKVLDFVSSRLSLVFIVDSTAAQENLSTLQAVLEVGRALELRVLIVQVVSQTNGQSC